MVAHPEPRAGVRIASYVLVDRLASGGKGEVWVARDEGLGRTVALKLLLADTVRERRRLLIEAQAVASLDHPHIATLFDYGDDPPYLAMQYIAGTPIDQAIADRLRCLRDAARGIHYAHQQNILHRDIKPSNILVDHGGTAYVVDFGLARLNDPQLMSEGNDGMPQPALQPTSPLTISGEILGTPSYMAPEQARGGQVDQRTDVYGLGATMYTLLSGRLPFDGATAFDIIEGVVEDEPAALEGDPDLIAICRQAMAKEPQRRYSSAEAFARDLDCWLQRLPVSAKRRDSWHHWWYVTHRSMQRQPAAWLLVILLSVSLILLVGQFLVATTRLGDLSAVKQSEQAQQQRIQELEHQLSEQERLLYHSHIHMRLWTIHRHEWQQLRAASERPLTAAQAATWLQRRAHLEQRCAETDIAGFRLIAAEAAWLRRDLVAMQGYLNAALLADDDFSRHLGIEQRAQELEQCMLWWQWAIPQAMLRALDLTPLSLPVAPPHDSQLPESWRWWWDAAEGNWAGIAYAAGEDIEQGTAGIAAGDSWQVWLLLSLSQWQRGEHDQSLQAARQALWHQPNDPLVAWWAQAVGLPVSTSTPVAMMPDAMHEVMAQYAARTRPEEEP